MPFPAGAKADVAVGAGVIVGVGVEAGIGVDVGPGVDVGAKVEVGVNVGGKEATSAPAGGAERRMAKPAAKTRTTSVADVSVKARYKGVTARSVDEFISTHNAKIRTMVPAYSPISSFHNSGRAAMNSSIN